MFLHDVRFGARVLARSPGFTAVALTTVALGVGLNSAIFSVVNSVLLRPLPYPDSGRIVRVYETNPHFAFDDMGVSAPNLLDWREQNHVCEEMALFRHGGVNVSGAGFNERLMGARVTAGLFTVLGTAAAHGRIFGPEENRPGSARSVVLSWPLWQRRFGADPRAIGRTLLLGGKTYVVAGVMPPRFAFPDRDVELWIPLEPDPRSRGDYGAGAIAKLKQGVGAQQAQTEIQGIADRLSKQYPNESPGWKVRVMPLQDYLVKDARTALLVLMGAVGFVLLIACANVANLLLARAPARRREIAIRTAIGATRLRIVRQLLIESVLLAAAAGIAGLALGRWGLSYLLTRIPQDMPRAGEIGMDSPALAFTFALALATGVIFGLVPAIETSRTDLSESLKEGGRSGAGSFARRRLRSVLVAAEVALSLVLLIGATLLVKSFLHLAGVDPGFRPDHLLTARVELPEKSYDSPARRAAFFRQVLDNITRVPLVQAAAAVDHLPMRESAGTGIAIEGRPEPKPPDILIVSYRHATRDYFRAMGMRLLRGRALSDQDAAPSAMRVAVITEAMARRCWPGEDAIGKRFRFGDAKEPWIAVVGILNDVRSYGLATVPEPEAFVPYERDPGAAMTLAVRTSGDPGALAPEVRRAVAAVDPNQPVARVESMDAIVRESLAGSRAYASLLGTFGALALALALVGIYGVIAYAVTERTREIGIRMALGARPSGVLVLVLRQALAMVAAGLLIGLAGAVALTRVLASELHGVRPADPATFAGVALAVTAVAAAAAWLPARKAAALDPSAALRYE